MTAPSAPAPPALDARLLSFVQASPDAFALLDVEHDATGTPSFRIALLNPVAAQLLGVPARTAAGLPLEPLLRRPGTQALLDQLPTALALVVEVDARFDRRDGPTWLRVQAFPVAGGVALMGRDVTDQHLAAALLQEQKAYLAHLARNLPAGCVLLFDRELRYRVVGGAALGQLGLEREALEGRSVWDAFPPELSESLAEEYERALAGEEHRCEVVEGGRLYERLLAPVYDAAGAIVGGMVLAADVTDARRQEEALRLAKEAAEQANAAKSDLLARMSHELRTPLNSVIGFSGVLQKNRGGRLGAEELDFVGRVNANGRHLLKVIDSMLDLSKIEAGRMAVELQPVDLRQLVGATLDQLAHATTLGAVTLGAELPEVLEPLETDPHKLRQVLINLVGNALKFTPSGRVTVRVVATAAGRVQAIEVEDTGIGIAPERQAAIFEAFEQAETGTARQYGGTGLGLTISRSLCHLLGFELGLRSAPGEGSVFRIGVARHD
ncbi:MAG: ATP-binding protein [Gemmatimonadales bacterium]|nr:ATP-binding protein [Gemmatimonadales bacterium]